MIYLITLVFLVSLSSAVIFQGESCQIEDSFSGIITHSEGSRSSNSKCWTIIVPKGKFVRIKFDSIKSEDCDVVYVKINTAEGNEDYKFCETNYENPFTSLSNTTVTKLSKRNSWWFTSGSLNFTLSYRIKDIECINKNSFQCNDNSCIPKDKVCDGIEDCANGADEIGCERGVFTIDGVNEARENAISWLKSKRSASWGWEEYTPRAIAALYLASGATFNGTIWEEELMAKETELQTAIALLKSSLASSELSTFINALLVTCHNPRNFYGNNLVKRLRDQVEASKEVTHPLAYLTLCNANETWPDKADSDLISYLNSSTKYPFVKDLQALSVMALSCSTNNTKHSINSSVLELYENTIQDLKAIQQNDGSIGNIYTTALTTQALLSSGQESKIDWNLTAAIKYLMKEINSSSIDLLSMHLILPILNGKTLIDVFKVNCSANPRKQGKDLISKINDHNGVKMRVQYSLYIGNDKDVIHTISLRVPVNSTAFEVMQYAASKDPKFKFEWKMMLGEVYVYEIANIKNDPEIGKFWLLYTIPDNPKKMVHLTTSIDKLFMKNTEHLIYWFKTASVSSN